MVHARYIFLGLLVLLPGCGKVVDWVRGTFPQVSYLDSRCAQAQKYIKSITTYDQLTTSAKFDALWLSNEVRILYCDLFVTKFGKTEEQKMTLLRRQFEENNHFISFYILSLYECPLGDPLSEWALFLNIDDKNYAPLEIKVVDLSPEYICIFGKKFNRFKVVYSVKFDAKNVEGNALLTQDTKDMSLYFRSTKKEAVLVWDLSFNVSEDAGNGA